MNAVLDVRVLVRVERDVVARPGVGELVGLTQLDDLVGKPGGQGSSSPWTSPRRRSARCRWCSDVGHLWVGSTPSSRTGSRRGQ